MRDYRVFVFYNKSSDKYITSEELATITGYSFVHIYRLIPKDLFVNTSIQQNFKIKGTKDYITIEVTRLR